MRKDLVIFKGSKQGIVAILNKDCSFTEIFDHIRQKLMDSANFFFGTDLNIDFKGRLLGENEKKELSEMIKDIIGGNVNISFREEFEETIKEDKKLEIEKKATIFSDIDEGMTKFYKGTVRSGQLITAENNLVIIGDVNPGAEVKAAGNIIVIGSVRGIIHAGCTGNRNAIVVALNLYPTQLRIADIITRSPDNESYNNEMTPEIAFVKENQIYIDAYLSKKTW